MHSPSGRGHQGLTSWTTGHTPWGHALRPGPTLGFGTAGGVERAEAALECRALASPLPFLATGLLTAAWL